MEPERPIEKLLRDWAKRRREDTKAPIEMHPATRRMLQGEAARKFGQTARPARSLSAWVTAFWPRIAWGLGVFAVLAVAAWLILPPLGGPSGTSRMAKTPASSYPEEFKRQPPLVNEPAPAPTDGIQPGLRDVRAENQILQDNSSDRKLTKEKVVRPPELASADKDSLELRAPAAPPTITDAARAQSPQPGARAGYAGGGPAQRTMPPVSSDGDRGSGVAQSAPSSLQAIPPGGAGIPAPAASSPPRPMAAAGPAPAASVVPAEGAQSSSSATLKSRYGMAMGGAKNDGSAAVTTALPPESSTEALSARGSLTKQAASEKGAVMSNRSSAAPSAPATTYFYADGNKKETSRQVQRFSRVETETKKALTLNTDASSKTILASFELQQVGNELRILDNDGSVYTGYVQPALLRSRGASPAKEEATGGSRAYRSVNGADTPSRSPEAETATAQNYSFRVSGTNRSLNVPVVFTGSVVAGEMPAVNTVTNAVLLRGVLREKDQFAPSPKTNTANLRISGHAVLGDREELDINAVVR